MAHEKQHENDHIQMRKANGEKRITQKYTDINRNAIKQPTENPELWKEVWEETEQY